jgi:hypothetical protein
MHHRQKLLELVYYREICSTISCHKGESTAALYIKTKTLLQSKQFCMLKVIT